MPGNAGPDYALLDRAGAAALIFHPRPDGRPPPATATDYAIEVEPGVELAARFYVLGPSYPTLLYFHGNGEVMGDHDGIAPLYHEAGANLFVTEFRGYGRSGGRPSVQHLVADAHPLVEHFHRTLDGDGFDDRRFIMGRSLGTQPALEVAARLDARFSGLIIESGAATVGRLLARYGLADTDEGRTLVAQHEAKIRSIRLPALLIHGEHDDLVPLEQATELYDLLSETEREFLILPGAGHNDLLWLGRDQYFEAIGRFVA